MDYKRKLQLVMLDMIKDIDKVCKKNNIEYSLSFGSVLGAVRHKGFIPWDDDMDIMMTYDNYLKFIDCCEKELNKNKYFVQNDKTEPNFYLRFTKIRNIQTVLIETSNKDEDITFGVYIDVFPLVGCPDNKYKRKFQNICRAFAMSVDRNVINNKLLSFIFNIIKSIFGKKIILKYCYNKCVKYDCKTSKDLCCIFDGDGYYKNIINKNDIFPTKRVDFEDTKLPIPNNYDKYLTKIYGNYMKIPSEEEKLKSTHKPYYINLNGGDIYGKK